MKVDIVDGVAHRIIGRMSWQLLDLGATYKVTGQNVAQMRETFLGIVDNSSMIGVVLPKIGPGAY